MKKFLLLPLIGFLFSCTNQEQKSKRNFEKDLFTFFDVRLKDVDSTIRLDSVRIIKFDTITANTILYRKIMSIYEDVDENQKKFNKALRDQNDAKQMIRLTAGLNSALYNNSLDDYKEKNAEMISLQKQDSALIKTADSLADRLKTTDSTTLVYFQVRCLLQYQRKDLSVSRDTGYAFLNKNKNIVRREDVFKQ